MSWSPFKFDDFNVEDLPNITTDRDIDAGIITANEIEDCKDDIFQSYKMTNESNVFGEAEELEVVDDEEVEAECGDKECSPFEESDEILDNIEDDEEDDDIIEAVIEDDEDDFIVDTVEDLPDDDDPEIDSNTEGIDEIEQDIIDDEEDDIIDAAMEGE